VVVQNQTDAVIPKLYEEDVMKKITFVTLLLIAACQPAPATQLCDSVYSMAHSTMELRQDGLSRDVIYQLFAPQIDHSGVRGLFAAILDSAYTFDLVMDEDRINETVAAFAEMHYSICMRETGNVL